MEELFSGYLRFLVEIMSNFECWLCKKILVSFLWQREYVCKQKQGTRFVQNGELTRIWSGCNLSRTTCVCLGTWLPFVTVLHGEGTLSLHTAQNRNRTVGR